MSKDYVGMTNCFICMEPTGLVLDQRLRKSLERNNIDPRPCKKCKELMQKGIIIVRTDGETFSGTFVVIREEAPFIQELSQQLKEVILQKRICFMKPNEFDIIFKDILNKQSEENNAKSIS